MSFWVCCTRCALNRNRSLIIFSHDERIAIDLGEELHRLNDMLESAMRQLEGARNAPRPSAADRDSMTFRKRPDSLQRSNAENARRMGVETVFKHFVKLGSLNCPIMMSGPRCVFMLLSFIV